MIGKGILTYVIINVHRILSYISPYSYYLTFFFYNQFHGGQYSVRISEQSWNLIGPSGRSLAHVC